MRKKGKALPSWARERRSSAEQGSTEEAGRAQRRRSRTPAPYSIRRAALRGRLCRARHWGRAIPEAGKSCGPDPAGLLGQGRRGARRRGPSAPHHPKMTCSTSMASAADVRATCAARPALRCGRGRGLLAGLLACSALLAASLPSRAHASAAPWSSVHLRGAAVVDSTARARAGAAADGVPRARRVMVLRGGQGEEGAAAEETAPKPPARRGRKPKAASQASDSVPASPIAAPPAEPHVEPPADSPEEAAAEEAAAPPTAAAPELEPEAAPAPSAAAASEAAAALDAAAATAAAAAAAAAAASHGGGGVHGAAPEPQHLNVYGAQDDGAAGAAMAPRFSPPTLSPPGAGGAGGVDLPEDLQARSPPEAGPTDIPQPDLVPAPPRIPNFSCARPLLRPPSGALPAPRPIHACGRAPAARRAAPRG
jgi:hypothetical protein